MQFKKEHQYIGQKHVEKIYCDPLDWFGGNHVQSLFTLDIFIES